MNSDHTLALLLESSGEGIYGMGPDSKCTFLNRAGAAMLGYTPEELVGRPIHNIIHHHHANGDLYPVTECKIGMAARMGNSIRVDDEVFWHKNGHAVDVTYSVNPIIVEGVNSGAVIAFSDVSNQRKIETSLRLSEERYKTLFASMDEGFCLVEILYSDDGRAKDYRFLETNKAFEMQSGLHHAVGKTIVELVPDFEIEWIETYAEVARTGTPFRFESEFKSMGYWFDVYVTRADSLGRISILFKDITERKRADNDLRRMTAELSEADRRKNEFLATLAHELRNPLAPIRNGLKLAPQLLSNPSALNNMFAMMERQVNQMVHLVDDLLDIARITTGKVELKLERMAIQEVIAQAVEGSVHLIEGKNHSLQQTIPNEPIYVDVDTTRMVQVVSNLINNAVKYSPENSSIQITVTQEKSEVVISLIDTGVGINASMLDSVFDMFSQVSQSSDMSEGGLGIGLSLVRKLIELHDGTVSVTSNGENQGSCFTLRLPVSSMLETERHKKKNFNTEITSSSIQTMRIMVVDDNEDAADTLSMLLEMSGHHVKVCYDGYQALELAVGFLPHIVFLDIGLPGLNGYEVARAIRKIPSLKTITLTALTGWGAERDRESATQAGFDHHLTKPLSLDVLQEILATVTVTD